MKVSVDDQVCQGHTLCTFAAPMLFKLRDEDGHAYVENPEVPAEYETAALNAAATCPEEAIKITY